jgi:hypothetical protein
MFLGVTYLILLRCGIDFFMIKDEPSEDEKEEITTGEKDKFYSVPSNNVVQEGGSEHGSEKDDWNPSEHTKLENFEHMVEKISDKKELKFNEDMVTTVMCFYLKKNDGKDKMWITKRQRAKYLAQTILIQILVLFMLIAQHYAWYTNENHEYHNVPDHSIILTLVKLPCIIALHFVLTPEVDNALKVMKFANQESHQFVGNGSLIVFCLAFLEALVSVYNLLMGVCLLTFQHSINHAIVHFIALHVISEVSEIYFEALASNNRMLWDIEPYLPEKETRGKDIQFSQRTCFHKLARFVYKIFRCFYTSVVFYFVPFLPVIIQFAHNYPKTSAHH